MKLILPAILAIIGLSVGTGAGIFLRPSPENTASNTAIPDAQSHASTQADKPETKPAAPASEQTPASGNEPAAKTGNDHNGKSASGPASEHEYVKLNNQFVVPVVKGPKVAALVVLSLSIEVTAGNKEAVFGLEPKLRDSFLQVLFDHANAGGFDGAFTAGEKMSDLRRSLTEAAIGVLGPVVSDVLVIDIVRQDV